MAWQEKIDKSTNAEPKIYVEVNEPNYPEIIKEKDRLIEQYAVLLIASEKQKAQLADEFERRVK
jgi:hypothetical protein